MRLDPTTPPWEQRRPAPTQGCVHGVWLFGDSCVECDRAEILSSNRRAFIPTVDDVRNAIEARR